MMISLSIQFETWFSTWSWTLAPLTPDEPEPDLDDDYDDFEDDDEIEVDAEDIEEVDVGEVDTVAGEADLRAEHVMAETSGVTTHARIGFRRPT